MHIAGSVSGASRAPRRAAPRRCRFGIPFASHDIRTVDTFGLADYTFQRDRDREKVRAGRTRERDSDNEIYLLCRVFDSLKAKHNVYFAPVMSIDVEFI